MTALLSLHLSSPTTADAQPARHAVRDAVAAACDDSTAADAEIVAGELIANAMLHAPGPIRIDVDRRGNQVRIEVTDQRVDAAPLPGRTPDVDATRGRGLAIVAAVAADWGWTVDADHGSKTVHAALDCGSRPPTTRAGAG
jgi:anti-sigma regulatory factor (Ser/Thr protein kinase)